MLGGVGLVGRTWIVVGRGMGRDGPGYFLQLPLAMDINLISEISYHLVVNHMSLVRSSIFSSQDRPRELLTYSQITFKPTRSQMTG